jgi:hypothetical protein
VSCGGGQCKERRQRSDLLERRGRPAARCSASDGESRLEAAHRVRVVEVNQGGELAECFKLGRACAGVFGYGCFE